MRLISILITAMALCAALAHAESATPRFQDYGTPEIPVTHNVKVRLNDAESRHYASQLKQATKRKPDFAGHYILASWGCGASCLMAAAIDAKTGVVAWLPFTVCCSDLDVTEPLAFGLDSRLLIIRGSRNEKGIIYLTCKDYPRSLDLITSRLAKNHVQGND